MNTISNMADDRVSTNWAGNISFRAQRIHRPGTVEQIQRLVAGGSAVKALGTGHSFNRIADTTGDLISVGGLPDRVEIDSAGLRVLVTGGTRYGELSRSLAGAGLALFNTGSLPHISVAGASATGTHGSGVGNPNLAAAVEALTMVTPSGDLVSVSRDSVGEEFPGSVLALGRLGIVTDLTLRLVPAFQVSQTVIEDVADDRVAPELFEILSAAYSVSIFTTWTPGSRSQIWLKRRVADELPVAGAIGTWGGRLATVELNPVPGMPPENATAQLGVPGPSNERLPHFRLAFTPSSGHELQSEYLLPLPFAGDAWVALSRIRDQIAPLLQVGEIRAVAGDDMWLSPSSGRDSVAFHFTWVPDTAAVLSVAGAIERELAPFQARPHWGKVFTTTPETLAELYPRIGDFRRLAEKYDPTGKFGNDEVDRWLRST
jgi:xylitol oxidase